MSSFSWESRVYWEDTDGGGIVYYANYLRFLERARTEWLRSLGYSQRALAEDPGIVFAVVNLNIEYRKPARLDDELLITCEPKVEGAASIVFAQRIYRSAGGTQVVTDRPGSLLVEASARVACLDVRTLRPKRLPAFLGDVDMLATAGSGANNEEPS
ncbi:MAG: tol-pal system-associated acyl-CoA thioesterase [Steroidobacteraceae bacterium]